MNTMIEDKAKRIDMSQYQKAGEGANGESFNHLTDETLMVKLYNRNADIEAVYKEMDVARKVYDAGIPSPEPGEFITDGDGRFGLKFRRLVDKVSYARALGNNETDEAKVEQLSRDFARMCKKLHSTHVDTNLFPNVKEQYLRYLEEDKNYNEAEKEVIKDIILNTPDATTAIHGDLQVGNALICGGQSYFIDLGEFACGHPYFDLGMTVVCALYNDAMFTNEAFHMHTSTMYKFWEFFVDEYFEGKLSLIEAEKLLLPYAVVKTLLIEKNAGCVIPNLHGLISLL